VREGDGGEAERKVMQCTRRVARYKEGPDEDLTRDHKGRDMQDPSASHQLDVLLLDGECPGPDAVHLFQALIQGLQSEAGHGWQGNRTKEPAVEGSPSEHCTRFSRSAFAMIRMSTRSDRGRPPFPRTAACILRGKCT